MSWVDLLLAITDPGTAALIVLLGVYLKLKTSSLNGSIEDLENEMKDELKRVRRRTRRLEDTYIPDGGEPEDDR